MENVAVSAVVPGVRLNDLSLDLSKVTVGFELEFTSPLTHAEFAKAMKDYDPDYRIGVVTSEYATHKAWGTSATRYKVWHVTGDPSITIDKKSKHNGIELISPAFPLNRAKRALLDVLAIIKTTGGTTNESTGLHVTFGHPALDTTLSNFDPLKFSVFMQEDKILARFDRERNQFAQNFSASILQAMYEEIQADGSFVNVGKDNDFGDSNEENYLKGYNQKDPDDTQDIPLTEDNLKYLLSTLRVRQRFAQFSHYMSINLIKLRSHCVEVRSPGGDYLSRTPEDLTQMVAHFARCLALAMDDTLLEDKYVLAVKRMMSQYKPEADVPTARKQSFKHVLDEAVKENGPTSLESMISLAGTPVQLRITHGSATNAKAEATAVYNVGGRVVIRLVVDKTGLTTITTPGADRLAGIKGASTVVNHVAVGLISVSDNSKPIPGLMNLAPDVQSYKRIKARFPKLTAIKLDPDTLQELREDLNILGSVA